jgi:hypothetical protein
VISPDTVRIRYVLVMFGLVAAFYCLASLSIARMPFTWTPSWWMQIWPSREIAVYVWFGFLNAAGAFVAAVPIGALLMWLIQQNRVRAAFTVAAPTAFLMVASVVVHYSPLNRASVFMTGELFLMVLLAVPLLVWAVSALPSTHRLGIFNRRGEAWTRD